MDPRTGNPRKKRPAGPSGSRQRSPAPASPPLLPLPSGFSPSHLDFRHLSASEFEEFCVALLHLHPRVPRVAANPDPSVVYRTILEAQRLQGGTDQRGADIHVRAEGGETWIFQCKHVREFHAKDVREAMQRMDTGFPMADIRVLITTCGLSDKAQEPLRARSDWLWWDAAKLTSLVQQSRPLEDAILLAHRFFPTETVRRLFPWSDQPLLNWEECHGNDLDPSSHRQFHHRAPFIAPPGALERLATFADQGAGRALIVFAAGGQGKSRLLLEFARDRDNRPGGPPVRFLNLGRPDALTDEQLDFLQLRTGEPLLLVIDDAHRLDSAVAGLARATRKSKTLRLLFLTRPQAVEALRSQLVQHGWSERIEEPYKLPRWRPEALQQMARAALGAGCQHRVDRLTELADGCPLLVILGAAQVVAGQPLDHLGTTEAFRERVYEGFIQDHLEQIPEADRTRVRRLIDALAFITPVSRDTAERSLSRVLDLGLLETGEHLCKLQAAGLVLDHREGVRLYPDLFAEAVLREACVGGKPGLPPLARRVLEVLDPAECPALLRNVAQADWELRILHPDSPSVFEPLWTGLREQYTRDDSNGRRKLLALWTPLAPFQPDRTLALATETLRDFTSEFIPEITPIVEAVAQWHPAFVAKALDLLWSVAPDFDPTGQGSDPHPITAIARIASYQVGKPRAIQENALAWLETTLTSPAGLDRLRRQPWILAAVSRPFFGTVVQRQSWTAAALSFSTFPVRLETTRPLRQRAMALAVTLAVRDDPALVRAAVPVLSEALRPLHPPWGHVPTVDDVRLWDEERHEALGSVKRIIAAARGPSVALQLFQIDQLLAAALSRCTDPEFQRMARSVRANIPRSLPFRTYHALAAWAEPHPPVPKGASEDGSPQRDSPTSVDVAREGISETAGEIASAWPLDEDLCHRVEAALDDLRAIGHPGNGWDLVGSIADISRERCSSLLSHLIARNETSLDHVIPVLLRNVARSHPNAYQAILSTADRLPGSRVIAVLDFMGWKSRHDGGLTPEEVAVLRDAAGRPEPEITLRMAQCVDHWFSADAELALDLLQRLRPRHPDAAEAFLRSLAGIVQDESESTALDAARVSACLHRLEPGQLDSTVDSHGSLGVIAARFPVAVYEFLRDAIAGPSSEPGDGFPTWRPGTVPALGRIPDAEYLGIELQARWRSASPDRPLRHHHLELARALVASDPPVGMGILRNILDTCGSGMELHTATEILAPRGSRFVFDHPDWVNRLLRRARQFAREDSIGLVLRDSALGGSRGWTDGLLDPEYRYILEQSELLARRYRDDPIPGRFYAGIAAAEGSSMEEVRRRITSTLDE